MAAGKHNARRIFEQTLASIDIPRMMEWKVSFRGTKLVLPDCCINLADISRVYVVAIGKAAHAMVAGLVNILPPRFSWSGILAAPILPASRIEQCMYFVGGHPIPNAESWKAAEAILRLLQSADERTLVFFLLSGGGSALVELPLNPEMNLEDIQEMNRVLVTCGAPIEAIN